MLTTISREGSTIDTVWWIRQSGPRILVLVIMADGRIPLRELVTNQNRGQLEILLAAGTSIQLENLKSKVCFDWSLESANQNLFKRSYISQILALDDEKSNTLIAWGGSFFEYKPEILDRVFFGQKSHYSKHFPILSSKKYSIEYFFLVNLLKNFARVFWIVSENFSLMFKLNHFPTGISLGVFQHVFPRSFIVEQMCNLVVPAWAKTAGIRAPEGIFPGTEKSKLLTPYWRKASILAHSL